MPTVEEVLALRQKAYEESVALVAKKGRDYNRKKQESGDTLFNIRLAAILGLTPNAAASALVRAADKFMRLASLMTSPDPPVNEKLWDTILDLHNYVDYSYLLWLEEGGKVQ